MAVRLDIKRGTTIRRGVLSRRWDRAVRVADVTGLSVSNAQDSSAISQAIASAGLFHHSETNLPLQYASVFSRGAGKCVVALNYFRGRNTTPTQEAATLARYRPGHDYVDWWTTGTLASDGRPAQTSWSIENAAGEVKTGITTGTSAAAGDKPISYQRRVSQVVIHVPTVLDSNPVATVEPKRGKLNSDAVTFGGHSFAANTLYFEGYTVDAVETSDQMVYPTWYTFIARKETWATEAAPTFSGTTWSVGSITVSFPTVAFAGAFPYHTP